MFNAIIRSEFGRILQIRCNTGRLHHARSYIYIYMYESIRGCAAVSSRLMAWPFSLNYDGSVHREYSPPPPRSPPSRRRLRWWYSGPVIPRLTIREQSCCCCCCLERRITVLSDSLSDERKKRKNENGKKFVSREISFETLESRNKSDFRRARYSKDTRWRYSILSSSAIAILEILG